MVPNIGSPDTSAYWNRYRFDQLPQKRRLRVIADLADPEEWPAPANRKDIQHSWVVDVLVADHAEVIIAAREPSTPIEGEQSVAVVSR